MKARDLQIGKSYTREYESDSDTYRVIRKDGDRVYGIWSDMNGEYCFWLDDEFDDWMNYV